MNGLRYNEIKQSEKNKVISLLGINSKVKIGERTITVDPLLLFQRICVMKKSDDELESYLKYKFAPYRLPLFDDIGMRKTVKSNLYSLFQSIDVHFNKESCLYFIDGGMLLFRVKWPTNCTYTIILTEYTRYLKRNFGGNIIVVFDAYNAQTTQIIERNRRSQKIACKEYQFIRDMTLNVTQENFLSNYKNKASS